MRSSTLRLASLLAAAAIALILASVAGATHVDGFGHANALAAGQSTSTTCDVATSCLAATNTNANNAARGLLGHHMNAAGDAPGVLGLTDSVAGNAAGVRGEVTAAPPGGSAAGVRGVIQSGSTFNGFGVYGLHNSAGSGVFGESTTGIGVQGIVGDPLTTSSGVFGEILDINTTNGVGVRGHHRSSGFGVVGTSASGAGVAGLADFGVAGAGDGASGVGVVGLGQLFAGFFSGNVHVQGTLTKSAGAFRIDHPLDPEHTYLQHAFVESPEMKNVYDGLVRTNARGLATVRLPRYFSALNRDFRYQLTLVGRAGFGEQAVVWKEIADNRFTIRTTKPNLRVSWQVTGVRRDAYANAHRIKVEVAKTGFERRLEDQIERQVASASRLSRGAARK